MGGAPSGGTPGEARGLLRQPVMQRRALLGYAAAVGGTALLAGGCARRLVPSASLPEPALTHYRLPYGSVSLPVNNAQPVRAYDELALLVALQGM